MAENLFETNHDAEKVSLALNNYRVIFIQSCFRFF